MEPIPQPSDPYRRERHQLLIVLTGPSAVGKDAVKDLLKKRGTPFDFVVTATDRAPRRGEVDGVHYCFFSTAEFERMIAANELLEWALVYDHHKGVPRHHVQRAFATGQDVLVRVDVQGAATILRKIPRAITVFLTCESDEELVRRLRGRHTESEEEMLKRIAEARSEMARIDEFKYVVVNRRDGLKAAADEVAAIIRAEHCRTDQEAVRL